MQSAVQIVVSPTDAIRARQYTSRHLRSIPSIKAAANATWTPSPTIPCNWIRPWLGFNRTIEIAPPPKSTCKAKSTIAVHPNTEWIIGGGFLCCLVTAECTPTLARITTTNMSMWCTRRRARSDNDEEEEVDNSTCPESWERRKESYKVVLYNPQCQCSTLKRLAVQHQNVGTLLATVETDSVSVGFSLAIIECNR